MKKMINASHEFAEEKLSILEKYLPDRGEGETKASQIATAVNKLVYRWYNDGDVFDNHYGLDEYGYNDVSSYANWLYGNVPGCKAILEKIYHNCSSGSAYEKILDDLLGLCGDNELLEKFNEQPAQGSIYNAQGPFDVSYLHDDERDYYDGTYDEYDYDEDYDPYEEDW